MGWATFLASFSQTHLIPLIPPIDIFCKGVDISGSLTHFFLVSGFADVDKFKPVFRETRDNHFWQSFK
jgi:hypothetical protein